MSAGGGVEDDTPETSGGSESQSASGIAGSSASRTSGSTTSEASGNGHTTDSTPSTRRGMFISEYLHHYYFMLNCNTLNYIRYEEKTEG